MSQPKIWTKTKSKYFSVYDVLTGKIVNSNRAHKDIVRDVAWHPKRNEILTSSWDCRVCLHYQLSKRSQLKRCLSQANCLPYSRSNPEGDNQGPPPRRSRRLAMRRQEQELNWLIFTHYTLLWLGAYLIFDENDKWVNRRWISYWIRRNETKIPTLGNAPRHLILYLM